MRTEDKGYGSGISLQIGRGSLALILTAASGGGFLAGVWPVGGNGIVSDSRLVHCERNEKRLESRDAELTGQLVKQGKFFADALAIRGVDVIAEKHGLMQRSVAGGSSVGKSSDN